MRHAFKASIGLMLALLLSACATPTPQTALTGSWGGRHAGLVLAEGGGTVEYDCASGTIDGPVVPAGDRSFQAAGTHTPGTGGPEQVGQTRPSFPARYSGWVRGDQLTLTVDASLPSGPTRIGPYSLRRGAQPELLRCL